MRQVLKATPRIIGSTNGSKSANRLDARRYQTLMNSIGYEVQKSTGKVSKHLFTDNVDSSAGPVIYKALSLDRSAAQSGRSTASGKARIIALVGKGCFPSMGRHLITWMACHNGCPRDAHRLEEPDLLARLQSTAAMEGNQWPRGSGSAYRVVHAIVGMGQMPMSCSVAHIDTARVMRCPGHRQCRWCRRSDLVHPGGV